MPGSDGRRRPPLRTLGRRVGTLDTRIAKPPSKTAAPHYGTPEHVTWRKAVIDRAGGRCQWPGCGRSDGRMFADHIVELSDGGAPLDLANGQCLCGSHHTLKTLAARAERTARPAGSGGGGVGSSGGLGA